MNIKLLFIPLLLFSSQLYAETIHLGILNTSGNEAENVLYAETASVLKDKLKPRNVEVSTYDLPGLEKAIAAGKLDFFISNPGFYVSSRQKLDTTALASQSNQFFSRPDRALGSVFVVPQQNNNNFSLRDLKGKSVCAVAPNAYGGLYIALGELNRRGFDPDKFFSSVHYSGYPMPKVLEDLKGGKCEAAIVRTCLLEELSSSGQIKSNEFRVIEPMPTSSNEYCIRSSELYPGWVFAATKNTSEALRKETTKILSRQFVLHHDIGGDKRQPWLYLGDGRNGVRRDGRCKGARRADRAFLRLDHRSYGGVRADPRAVKIYRAIQQSLHCVQIACGVQG